MDLAKTQLRGVLPTYYQYTKDTQIYQPIGGRKTVFGKQTDRGLERQPWITKLKKGNEADEPDVYAASASTSVPSNSSLLSL